MSVKVLILAAGKGERMLPLTSKLAKPAIHFLNRPLIHYSLDYAHALGQAPVGINLHHLPQSVKSAVAAWEGPGFDIHWSPEKTLMGTGGALEGFRGWAGQAPVLLTNGDTLCQFEPRGLFAALEKSGAPAVLLTRPNPDPAGIPSVIVDGGRVRQIAGLPRGAVPPGEVRMFAGRHALAPGFIARHATPVASDINHDIYPSLITAGQFPVALDMESPIWADVGTRDRYLVATRAALKALHAGKWPLTQARDSRLQVTASGGLLYHDQRARVRPEKFRVEGFAVIGEGCFVGEGVVLRDSVLLPGAKAGPGAHIENTIVGPGVLVAAGRKVVDALAC